MFKTTKKFLFFLLFISVNVFGTLNLTEEEQKYINNSETLKMAVDPDWMPYEKIDLNGEYVGIGADFIKLLEEKTGLKITLVVTKNWEETLKLSKEGKVDILPFLNQTSERDKWLNFTNPVYIDPTVIITREDSPYIVDIRNLFKKTVIFPKGTSLEEKFRKDYPNFNVKTVETEKEVFEMIQNKKADFTLRSLTVAAYTIRKDGLINLKISGQVPEYTNFFRIGVSKNKPLLRDILNKGIAEITPQEIENISNKHVYIKVEEVVNYEPLKRIILISVLCAMFLLYKNHSQKQENMKINKLANELKISEEKYRLLTEFTSDVTWVLNLNKKKFTYISPTVYYLRGITAQEALNETLEESLTPESIDIVKSAIDKNLETFLKDPEQNRYYLHEIEQLCKDGRIVPVEVGTQFRYNQDKEIEIVGVSRNISDRKKAEKEILYLSYHDQLTGLYNRRFLEREIKRLDTEENLPLTLVMFDANGLKLVNDSFGHQLGDILIQKSAEFLKKNFRENDIIARTGGDEFVALLPRTSFSLANQILQRMEGSIKDEKIKYVNLSISWGLATKTELNEDISYIYKLAEDSMYEKKNSEKNSVREETINIIKESLYEKAPSEKEHAQEVSELSVKIGKKLNLSEKEIGHLEKSAYYHDIGKIVLDIDILNKPGKLTEKEWMEVKRHSQVGFDILSTSIAYAPLVDAILHHHEHWNGSSNPQRLKGEEIPLFSRIIMIADSYQAMTSDRPYRRAFTHEEAITLIKKGSASQFDPKIVEIFLKTI